MSHLHKQLGEIPSIFECQRGHLLIVYSSQAQVHPSADMGQEYSSYLKENKSSDSDERSVPLGAQDHTEAGRVASSKGQDHIIDLEDYEETDSAGSVNKVEDVQITPKASFMNLHKPLNAPPKGSPSGFFALDEKDRKTILEMVLRRSKPFRPLYHATSSQMPDYYEEVFDAERNMWWSKMIVVDNINIPLLKVNKQMSREASAIFYGVNIFKLTNAEASKWWLQCIGTNIVKVRKIHLVLKGFEHPAFQIREERFWLMFLAYYHRFQNLSDITIDFSDWEPVDFSKKWDHTRICLHRKNCVDTLAKFSGLETVTIFKGEFITEHDARRLTQVMMRKRGSETPPFDFQISAENAVHVDIKCIKRYISNQTSNSKDKE